MRPLLAGRAARQKTRFVPPFQPKRQSLVDTREQAAALRDSVARYPAYALMRAKTEAVRERFRKDRRPTNRVTSPLPSMPHYYRLLDRVREDPATGVFLGLGFEEELARLRRDGFTFRRPQPFDDAWAALQRSLCGMDELRLLDALRASVALRLSRDLADRLKGELLKAALNDREALLGQADRERLAFRAALAVVNAKIDAVLYARQKNSAHEAAEYVRLLRGDPAVDPAYYSSLAFIRRLYPLSAAAVAEPPSAPARLNEQRGLAAAAALASHLGRPLGTRNSLELPAEAEQNVVDASVEKMVARKAEELRQRMKKEVGIEREPPRELSEEERQTRELAEHLARVLGAEAVVTSLDNQIARLEMQLGLCSVAPPPRSALEGQVEALLALLPPHILARHMVATNENDARFRPRYANNTDSFLALQWHNLDLDVPAAFMPVKEFKKSEELFLNAAKYRKHFGELQTAELLAEEKLLLLNRELPRRLSPPPQPRALPLSIEFKIRNPVIQPDKFRVPMRNALITFMRHEKNLQATREEVRQLSRSPLVRRQRLLGKRNFLVRYFDEVQHDHQRRLFDRFNRFYYLSRDQSDISTMKFTFNSTAQLPPERLNLFRGKSLSRAMLVDFYIELFENTLPVVPTAPGPFRPESYSRFSEPLLPVQDAPPFRPPPSLAERLEQTYAGLAGQSAELRRCELAALEMLNEVEQDDVYRHYFEAVFGLLSGAPLLGARALAGDHAADSFSRGLALGQAQLSAQGLLVRPKKAAVAAAKSNLKVLKENEWLLKRDPAYRPEQVAASFFGKGSRKTSRAFAVLSKAGSGRITVNKREFIEYFNVQCNRFTVIRSLVALDLCHAVDLQLYVYGGGNMSQAEACLIAVSKALIAAFPEHETFLLRRYFTFADGRNVQPKNTGKYKARKSYTYVRR